MRLFHLLSALMILSTLTASGAYRRNTEQSIACRTEKLENPFLMLTFAPDQLGRLSGIRLKNSGTELLADFQVIRYVETPLFSLTSDNFQGIRELLWGKNMTGICPMRLEKQTTGFLTFATDSYGNTSFGLQRTVRLHPDGYRIDFSVTLFNNGKAADSCALWLNLQGAPPAIPQIPVRGEGKVRGRGMIRLHTRDFLFCGGPGEHYLPGAADWAAVRLSGRSVVWALVCDRESLGPDAFFYSWGNRAPSSPVRTAEIVFPEKKLNPGEKSVPLRYRILVFPGLNAVHGVCADHGVEITAENDETGAGGVRIVNALPRPAETLSLSLSFEGKDPGQNVQLSLPARPAGTLLEIPLQLRNTPGGGRIRIGNTSGQLFFEKPCLN